MKSIPWHSRTLFLNCIFNDRVIVSADEEADGILEAIYDEKLEEDVRQNKSFYQQWK